jgi:hypothetical protein
MSRLGAGALLCALLIATPLAAQECKPTDSVGACWALFNPPPTEASEAAEATADTEATEDATATAATGITNTASPAESSLKDFLSLLAASMESATSSEQGQAFTFDWNPPIAFAENWGVKLQASFAETNLNAQVTQHLSGNADELKELQDSLEFGDDTTLSGFLQPQNARYGRSIQPHRDWFREMRKAVLADRQAESTEFGRLTEALNVINMNQRFENITDEDGTKLTAEQVQTRINAVVDLAKRIQAARGKRAKFFMAFAKLLNNQPQVYGAAIYHARRNLIGPNEWSGKFTYEFAGNNLNRFKDDHDDCDEVAEVKATPAKCAAALESFADAMQRGLERVSVSLEYHKANRRWIDDPTAGLAFGFPGTRSFIGSVAFGTNMSPMLPLRTANATGVGDARLDFTAKYELPEDNDSEEKGFVGTLTYTQKISETFSLPLSFVYSDHESDLINVQKRFSARFGLMYKLPDFK